MNNLKSDRTFLALPVPDNVKTYLSEFQSRFHTKGDRINWVSAENLHITLFFLGDTAENLIESIDEDIARVTTDTQAFRTVLTETGVFPHANNPRVLWTGTFTPGDDITRLKKRTDIIMRQHGYKVDNRKFSPHITLGRVKTITRQSTLIHDYLSTELHDLEFSINTLSWFRSILTPRGPVYELIREYKFNTGGIS